MNIFFVIDNEIITPQLTGTILPGITRDSVLRLSRSWGLKTSERRITIDETVRAIEDGSLTEIFGSGTAAVISPVSALHYREKEHSIGDGTTGPIARRFFDEIMGIQYGKAQDLFQWLDPILWVMNKSFLTNLIAAAVFLITYLSPPFAWQVYLSQASLFALSGALTNWLAIYMLFEKVPGFYGSGIIPLHFEEFKSGIRTLIM